MRPQRLSHPNICTIHEVDDREGKPFIVMEYVEGETLRQKVRRGPLPLEEALDITIQAAEGLEKPIRKGSFTGTSRAPTSW